MGQKERIRFKGHNRCPYCHDSVREISERAACAHCLAVHHIGCWREHGRCASCAADEPLLPPGERAPTSAEERGSPATDELTFDEAQWKLEITRVELEWLIEKQRIRPVLTKAGQRIPSQEVEALSRIIVALMNEREEELRVGGGSSGDTAFRIWPRGCQPAAQLGLSSSWWSSPSPSW